MPSAPYSLPRHPFFANGPPALTASHCHQCRLPLPPTTFVILARLHLLALTSPLTSSTNTGLSSALSASHCTFFLAPRADHLNKIHPPPLCSNDRTNLPSHRICNLRAPVHSPIIPYAIPCFLEQSQAFPSPQLPFEPIASKPSPPSVRQLR